MERIHGCGTLLKLDSHEEAVDADFCIVCLGNLDGDKLMIVAIVECLVNGGRGGCYSKQR